MQIPPLAAQVLDEYAEVRLSDAPDNVIEILNLLMVANGREKIAAEEMDSLTVLQMLNEAIKAETKSKKRGRDLN